jgi:thiosulfate/3-mercaptopyruvate sulfurtransferase
MTTTLADVAAVQTMMQTGAPVVLLDCRFDLADTEAGRRTFDQGHVPGARHVHLDLDLSGAKTAHSGRHPLPNRAAFAAQVGAWGITPRTQVLAYDAQGGCYAARAWWMLRWLGHEAVAVLDGGWQAWVAAGADVEVGGDAASTPAPPYPERAPLVAQMDASALAAELGRLTLIDARAAERFRGDSETLDPVAGHIPGALNRFFKDNLQADGHFKPAAELRSAFTTLGAASGVVVHQCGSGVTACHNLLAMEHAGLHGSLLYVGSWSQWCSDPGRPVAVG